MPLNDKKLVSIICEQCAEIEERRDGYKNKILKLISIVLALERDHLVSHTNIQQKINEECTETAQFLSEQRGQDTVTEKLES